MTNEETKLEVILKLPFEEYMHECWQHVQNLAINDPIANIVYQEFVKSPAHAEALWARRYWFSKVGEIR